MLKGPSKAAAVRPGATLRIPKDLHAAGQRERVELQEKILIIGTGATRRNIHEDTVSKTRLLCHGQDYDSETGS